MNEFFHLYELPAYFTVEILIRQNIYILKKLKISLVDFFYINLSSLFLTILINHIFANIFRKIFQKSNKQNIENECLKTDYFKTFPDCEQTSYFTGKC